MKNRKSVLSITLTLSIITLLIFSGPVSAVQVGIGTLSSSTPSEGSAVSFLVYVDVELNEMVPVKNLTLVIDDSGRDNACHFRPDGAEIGGSLCGNVTIVQLYASTSVNWSNATNYYSYGYGYGYTATGWVYNTTNTTFYAGDYGYGYGYSAGYSFSANVMAELTYNVTWTTPGVTANKTYNIYLVANVDDNTSATSWRTYENANPTTLIVVDAGALQGNVSDVVTTGVGNLTIRINGSDDLTQNVSGELTLNFTDGNESIMEFDWNFTQENLTLNTIKINKTFANGSETVVVSGLNLSAQGKTKTVYLNQTNASLNSVCVLDRDIVNISSMTSDCSGSGEVSVECNGVAQSGYTCTDLGSVLRVGGLSYTGLRQISYTIPTTNATTPTSSSSSGSTPAVTSNILASASQMWSSIQANAQTTMDINKDNLAFTKLLFTLGITSSNNPSLTVDSLTGRPSATSVVPPGTVYQYIKVSRYNIYDVTSLKISFRVKKDWLSDNNIDENTITLYRYHNSAWNALTTTLKSSDNTYTSYEADSTDFSYFVISGTSKTIVAEVAAENVTEEVSAEEVPPEEKAEEKEKITSIIVKKVRWGLIITFVILIAIASLIYIYLKKQPGEPPLLNLKKKVKEFYSHIKTKLSRKKHHKPSHVSSKLLKEAKDFIRKQRSKGKNDEQIRISLMLSGWPEKKAEDLLKKKE